jgi:hypothetical protein
MYYVTFVNTHRVEKFLTPAKFAELMCEDLGVGTSHRGAISASIQKQLQDHQEFFEYDYSEPDAKVDIKVRCGCVVGSCVVI